MTRVRRRWKLSRNANKVTDAAAGSELTNEPSGLTKTCPSAPAEVGSVVLGVVIAQGQVAYLTPNVPVTTELLEELHGHGIPVENRMRFACACREHGCRDGTAPRALAVVAGWLIVQLRSSQLTRGLRTYRHAVSAQPAAGSPSTSEEHAPHVRKSFAGRPRNHRQLHRRELVGALRAIAQGVEMPSQIEAERATVLRASC